MNSSFSSDSSKKELGSVQYSIDLSSINDKVCQDTTLSDTDNNLPPYRPTTKLPGVTIKTYEFDSTHCDLEAAKKAIDQGLIGSQNWTRGVKYQTKGGEKICYTCRSFAKCPKKMYLFLDYERQNIHAHVSTDKHNHLISSRLILNPQSKKKVLELIDSGVVQPRRLLKELEKHHLPPLTKLQINNLKARLKNRNMVGKKKLDIAKARHSHS